MAHLVLSFELFVAFCLLLAFYLFLHRRGRMKNQRFPPGPTPFPIVGNLFQLRTMPPNIQIRKWTKQYGPIVGLTIGSERVVILDNVKLGRELFSDLRACGRLSNPVADVYSGGNFGILQSNGSVWNEQRRFAIRTLKDLGFAKNSMESRILSEVTCFLNLLNEKKGEPIPVNGCFFQPVHKIIWSIVSGESCNPEATQIAQEAMETALRIAKNGLLVLPALRHILPELTGWNKIVRMANKMKNMINATISKQAEALGDGEPGEFISHYLQHMSKETDPSSSFYKENGRRNLVQVIIDTLIAGNDTTASVLEYLMLYLSSHTEIQRNMQKEIDAVIGQIAQPSLTNRASMPYTEAVIIETFRVPAILPISIPHTMVEDMEFHGYVLPKGAMILMDLQSMCWDTKRWGDDAKVFRPERHLSENNTKYNVPEDVISFGVGRRQCPGEAVAMDILFLFVTSILQSFNLEMDPNSENVDLSSIYDIGIKPRPFNILVMQRGDIL